MTTDMCSCQDPGRAPAEAVIYNRPALRSIRYRIGTYSTFRRAMLAAISKPPALSRWQVRDDDDYGIAFIDMWAYLGDILTFYQERIANESFLRTATEQESVARLAATLDYKPAAGMAAQTYLAFDAEKDKHVTIPVGLKVQSVPGQGEMPQKFETLEAITAYSTLNRIGLQLTQTQEVHKGQTHLMLSGTDTRLVVGDYVLIVVSQPTTEWDLRQLTSVKVDPSSHTTTVGWIKPTVLDFQTLLPWGAQVFALRQQASLFGHNAPDWLTIPESWKCVAGSKTTDCYWNWNTAVLPEDTTYPADIYLDKVYPQVQPNTWAVLITEEPSHRMKALFSATKVAKSSRTNYTLSAAVTRLTTSPAPASSTFSIRSTLVLAQSEELVLADVAMPTVSGFELHLDGVYPDLAAGRLILIHGQLATGEVQTELLRVEKVDVTKGTVITLHETLKPYQTSSVTIYGNVALGGHGESVAEAPLGSGDSSIAFHSLTLPKSPVTFVPHAGSLHGARNTLVVRVGGVEWTEVPTLHGRISSDAIYTSDVDRESKMTVIFGDGTTGARLPTGQNNVTAAYRRGIGISGNVRSSTLTNLLDRPVGLSSVVNPASASGGADAEGPDQIRANAPNTVRTFGRIVSLQDFEDAAREYSGIEKARAALFTTPAGEEIVQLTVAGVAKQIPDKATLALLKADLDSRRDPNQKLLVQPGETKSITVAVAVDHAADRKAVDVQAAVRQALLDYLAWDQVDFGQTIELSDVYRVVQSVTGVVGARVTRLALLGSTDVKPRISLPATALPELAAADIQSDDWTPETL